MRIYRDLLEIKKIDFFEEYENIQSPEDRDKYAKKTSVLMTKMLKSVMMLVCNNKEERDILRYAIKVVQA